jgi:hypothetical protein
MGSFLRKPNGFGRYLLPSHFYFSVPKTFHLYEEWNLGEWGSF